MDDKPPAKWALHEAWKKINSVPTAYGVTAASVAAQLLARMIEKHERPPIDPDILLARQVIVDDFKDEFSDVFCNEVAAGNRDEYFQLRLVVAAIKRVRREGLSCAS